MSSARSAWSCSDRRTATGRSIYLDWIRAYCTVAGTGGVAAFLKVELDKIVPTGGTLLADLGARVIKVEPPEGDPYRGMGHGTMKTTANFRSCTGRSP